MKRDRTVLLANAGSGKTFTLANRVLAWCLSEVRAGRPAAPADILAVTFTRKAAGEILARIVWHAALGARDDGVGLEARKDFKDTVGDATLEEYRVILAALCLDLHRMQVGTIDGYLHRIASAMPEEFGLPADWTIAEPHQLDEIHAIATAAVLADPVAENLLDLLEDGAPKPSVGASIDGLLGESACSVLTLYRATVVSSTRADGETSGSAATFERAWHWAQRLRERLVGSNSRVRKSELDQLIVDLENAPLATNAKGEVNGKWKPAHKKVLDALREGRIRDAGTKFVTGILESDRYYNVSAPTGLAPILQRVARAVQVAHLDDLVRRMEGAVQAMPIAERAIREAQVASGLFSFSDIGRFVGQAARDPNSRASKADEIRAALGCDVRALAIDEAQDTSVAQLRALRPLINDAIGATNAGNDDQGAHAEHAVVGGKFLLVGDPKQSIYGWRGGVPGQIDRFRREAAAFLDPDETLAKSYRSSPLIMEFVNAVFGTLEADLLPLTTEEERADLVGTVDFLRAEGIDACASSSAMKRVLDEWKFIPHEAARPEIPGWIHCYMAGEYVVESMDETVDQESEIDERETKLGGDVGGDIEEDVEEDEFGSEQVFEVSIPEMVAQVVARIHRERPKSTVGVLVRDNKSLADIVACLKEEGIDASDEGRSTLLDAPPVMLLVHLLQLIDSPSNRVAHFVVSHSALAKPLGLFPSEEHGSAKAADHAAVRFAQLMRGRIADQGLGAFLQSIFRILDACSLPPRDRARLARAVSLAELFEAKPPARLTEIVTAIAADESGAESGHPVRVMTIHASKGLEFDEVVLASLHSPWDRSPRGWGMLVTDPSKDPDMVGPLMNATVREWIPELELLRRDNLRRELLDAVSSLYVAMTRAKKGIHCVFDQRLSLEKLTGAGLIASVLGRLARNASDETSLPAVDAGTPLPASIWRDAGDFTEAREDAVPGNEDPFWSVTFAGICASSDSAPQPMEGASKTVAAANVATTLAMGRTAEPLFTVQANDAGHAAIKSKVELETRSVVSREPERETSAGAISESGRSEDKIAAQTSSEPPDGASARPPSEHRASSPWAQDPFGDDDIAVRGVLVHEFFRHVRDIEELVGDPSAIAAEGARLRAAMLRTAVEKATPIGRAIATDVASMLQCLMAGVGRVDSVAEALRVGASDEVRTEVPFVRAVHSDIPSRRAALVHGRIDRLVLSHDSQGRVTHATVLDFKTGAVHTPSDAFAAKVSLYRAQLEAYREAVCELWRLPPHAVVIKLLFVDRDEVVV